MEPSSNLNGNSDTVVEGLVNDARVCRNELGLVIGDSEKVADGASSVALVSSVANRSSDSEVKIRDEMLESKNGSVTTELCFKVSGDARVSKAELGLVVENSEKVLDESAFDGNNGVRNGFGLLEAKSVGVVTEWSSDSDKINDSVGGGTVQGSVDAAVMENFGASSGVKIGDELVDSKSGAVAMETPSEHGGKNDTVVPDIVGDTRDFKDELGSVIDNSAKVMDKTSSDAVVSSGLLGNKIMHSADFGAKNLFKARIAALYAAAEEVQRDDCFSMDLLDTIKMNPLGEMQDFVLETPSGKLFGSDAIARYVARGSSLMGLTQIDFGRIEQWVGFSSVELDLNIRGWTLLRLGYFKKRDKLVELHYTTYLKMALKALNTYLASREGEVLVGKSVTLADIITTCNLLYGFKFLMSQNFTSKFPNVEKYFWNMIDRPNFKNVIGEVKQADSVIPYSLAMESERPKEPERKAVPKNEEVPTTVTIVNEDAKPDNHLHSPSIQEEANQDNHLHSPSVQEEAKQDNHLHSPSVQEEAKQDNHLNSPSNMVLDDWKKFYSSIKTKRYLDEAAIKDFLDKFAAKSYPLWFCEYKHNDKNARLTYTKEMVKDFFSPLRLFRRYIFGKILITGNTAPYKVKGFWLFCPVQATDLVLEHCKESFVVTKVDLSDEDKKKRVIEMIKNEDCFEDEEIVHDCSYPV